MEIKLKWWLTSKIDKWWFGLLYWKLLYKSGIFRAWYRRHINTVLYDLEAGDFIDKKRTQQKYLKCLEK